MPKLVSDYSPAFSTRPITELASPGRFVLAVTKGEHDELGKFAFDRRIDGRGGPGSCDRCSCCIWSCRCCGRWLWWLRSGRIEWMLRSLRKGESARQAQGEAEWVRQEAQGLLRPDAVLCAAATTSTASAVLQSDTVLRSVRDTATESARQDPRPVAQEQVLRYGL